MSKRQSSLLALVVLLNVSARSAFAEAGLSMPEARQIAKEGLIALDRGRNDEAVSKLTRAYRTVKVPTLGVFTAQALTSQGRLVEAVAIYLEIAELKASGTNRQKQLQAKKTAEKALAALLARVPRLTVRLSESVTCATELSIDSEVVLSPWDGVERMVDPGPHVITLRSLEMSISREITLKEGDHMAVTLSPIPDSGASSPPSRNSVGPAVPNVTTSPAESGAVPKTERPPVSVHAPSAPTDLGLAKPALDVHSAALDVASARANEGRPEAQKVRATFPRQTLIWAGLATAGTGLIASGTLSILARRARGPLDQTGCVNTHCYADQQREVDRYNTMRAGSTIGLSVAAFGLASAVFLLVTRPSLPSSRPTVGLALTYDPMVLGGQF